MIIGCLRRLSLFVSSQPDPTLRELWPRTRTAGALLLCSAMIALAGCATGRPLMPTPNIYSSGIEVPHGGLAPQLESNAASVLYVTDRKPGRTDEGKPTYTHHRSPTMAFGTATVVLGASETWPTLAKDARRANRERPIHLSLRSFDELARGPGVPLAFEIVDGLPETRPEIQAALEAAVEQFRHEMRERLALTARKEVFIFVHGVANTFEDAVFTTAELWHYLGREGVPIAYTWPAGGTGITGYTYDRESSEYTITHMKHFLKLLTLMPEVEKVHLIAHSRGTDVVTTTLRELIIESRARGEDPRQRFRIKNLVLAAPDIDLGVALQRSASAHVSSYVERFTIYSSEQDKAIGVAQWLFGEDLRLGRLDYDSTPTDLRGFMENVPNLAIVQYTGTRAGSFGHNYFRTNPAVASDLVLAVRYDRDPGAQNGRPLKHSGLIFWQIDDSYLAKVAP